MVIEMTFMERMLDFMSNVPTSQEILAIKTTREEQARIYYLMHLNSAGNISPELEEELREYLLVESWISRAKARAYGKLNKQ